MAERLGDSDYAESWPHSFRIAATSALKTADRRVMGVPAPRPGLIDRHSLVTTTLDSPASVITVVAPAGYGKTTLLAQLAERLHPNAAWLSCEGIGNDPATLVNAIIAALERIAPPSWAGTEVLAQTGGGLEAIPGLVSTFSEIRGRVTLLLDNVEMIRNRECWAALTEFALRLPVGWRFVLASREAVGLPISRLRMQADLHEIGVDELAMASDEAKTLLAGAGLDVAVPEVEELVRQTEGWPAGLYLASLAMKAGSPTRSFTFAGDDPLMRDYLRSELLSGVSPSQWEFLVRTSVLDRMCGPLCDAVVGGTGAARFLEQLEARNLLVVPLDRHREWYRYHNLLRDLLQRELQNLDPGTIRDLHLRASEWFRADGMTEAAIWHAQEAEDSDLVAQLVLDAMQPLWASGRVDTVRDWMEWLSEHPPRLFYPAIAAHGSLIFALLGRTGEAERWSAIAETLPAKGVLPDGSTEEGTLAYLRTIMARDGLMASRREAAVALDGLSPVSPYRATMSHSIGLSFLLDGDLDAADAAFAEAHELAAATGATPLIALVLAEQYLVEVARGDAEAADEYLVEAVETVDGARLDSFWTSALVLAVAARSRLRHGQVIEARDYAMRAARLRPLLTHMLPVVSVQALVELAHAYLELVDAAGARAALHQARGILLRRPDLGNLRSASDELQLHLNQLATAPPAGASALTAAELRILPFLATHLSIPQIADQFSLSRHTIKAQVASVYRKLGVSSRREAVDRMNMLGISV